jgi:hypothetical protein
MNSDPLIPGAVYLDLAGAPRVKFTVLCPSCLKMSTTEVDCSVLVFDVMALWCPCGVKTDVSGRSQH